MKEYLKGIFLLGAAFIGGVISISGTYLLESKNETRLINRIVREEKKTAYLKINDKICPFLDSLIKIEILLKDHSIEGKKIKSYNLSSDLNDKINLSCTAFNEVVKVINENSLFIENNLIFLVRPLTEKFGNLLKIIVTDKNEGLLESVAKYGIEGPEVSLDDYLKKEYEIMSFIEDLRNEMRKDLGYMPFKK